MDWTNMKMTISAVWRGHYLLFVVKEGNLDGPDTRCSLGKGTVPTAHFYVFGNISMCLDKGVSNQKNVEKISFPDLMKFGTYFKLVPNR